MSRTTALTKLRTTATGELRQTAAKALRALPPHLPTIPEASDGQARLESLFLANLNRLHTVAHPADPPFAIRRCTPGVTDIVIEIARPHLSAVLNQTLPRAVPDQDLDGIPGLRAHHHRGHLVLEHLRLAGRIRIPLDLHVARRRSGGWDLFAPWLHFGLLEHLRQVAHSPACPRLWPADIQDMLSPYGEFTIVRIRGVDIVFHDPAPGEG
jgi:hypothetical protein